MVQQATHAALHLFRSPLQEVPALVFRPGQPLQNLRNFRSGGLSSLKATQDDIFGDLISRVQVSP